MHNSHVLTLPTASRIDRKIAAIGDVHGDAELFQAALNAISDPKETVLILMGDIIDRGPDVSGCLALLAETESLFKEVIMLPGNHEELAWNSVPEHSPRWASWREFWMKSGGEATLNAFNHDHQRLLTAFPQQLKDRLRGRLPVFHQEGALLFVHAGLNPRYDTQRFLSYDPMIFFRSAEMSPLWVRREFYGQPGPYEGPDGDEVIVVYGHTGIRANTQEELVERVDMDTPEWRIPLDTSGSGGISVLNIENGEARIDMIWDPQKKVDPWDVIKNIGWT